jgi:hypothetical protein
VAKGQKGGVVTPLIAAAGARRIAAITAKARKHGAENAGPDTPLVTGGQMHSGPDNFASKEGTREKFIARYEDGTEEEQWLVVPPERKRCTGNVRNGPYTGQRCRKLSLLGARVCLNHGGTLPAVKRAAERRLLASLDIAVRGLLEIAFERPNVKDSDRITAMRLLMDRGGLDAKQTIQLEVKPYEKVIQRMADGKGKKGKGKRKKSKHKVIDGELADAVGTETFDHWEKNTDDEE